MYTSLMVIVKVTVSIFMSHHGNHKLVYTIIPFLDFSAGVDTCVSLMAIVEVTVSILLHCMFSTCTTCCLL